MRDDCAKDLPGTLKQVAAMGYQGVEFAGYYGRSPDELKRMLVEDHLQCLGSHVGLDDLLGDRLAKTAEFAKALGCKILIVPSLPDQMVGSHDAIVRTARTFSDIARRLRPYGLTLAFHDEANVFRPIDGEMPWVVFFRAADPSVKIEFDTGNALSAGAQAAPYIAMFPGRVVSVHLKDFSSTNPNVLLGDGDEHWNEVLPLIEGPAGTRNFVVEQETYPFPPLESVRRCLANLKRMLTAGHSP